MRFYSYICDLFGSWPLWLKAIAVGIMFGSGFVAPVASIISVIGLGLFFLLIKDLPTLRETVKVSWIVWYIQSLCVFLCFWSAYPIEWIDFDSEFVQIPIIAFYWLTVSLWLSVTGVVLAFGSWYGLKRMVWLRDWRFLFLAAWVVIAEQLGTLAFSLMTIGPNITPNFYLGVGKIGNVAANLPGIVFFARWGGSYFLSLLVALVVIYIVYGQWKNVLVRTVTMLSILSVLVTFNILSVTVPNPDVTVAIIDTNFTNSFLSDKEGQDQKQADLRDAVKIALAHDVDFIVLPEGAGLLQSLDTEMPRDTVPAYLKFAFNAGDTVIIDSARETAETGDTVLRASIYGGKYEKPVEVDKQYLVPQGEFIPYFYAAILRIFGYGEALVKLQNDHSYRPGPIHSLPLDAPPILFCFESINPLGVFYINNRSAPFIAHPISHAWFNDPTLINNQLNTLLRIQSVWNQSIIVSANNMSESRVYYPDGTTGQGKVVAEGDRYKVRLIDLSIK